jgi:hypothetical protein
MEHYQATYRCRMAMIVDSLSLAEGVGDQICLHSSKAGLAGEI